MARAGETHLNFLLGKKENQAKFVAILLKIVGWVERNSLMIINLRGVSECPLCMNMSKIRVKPNINRKFYRHETSSKLDAFPLVARGLSPVRS